MHGDNIEKAFYVCAIIPQNGDSVRTILHEDANSELKKTFRLNKEKCVLELISENLDDVVYNGCSIEDIEYAKERMVPQSVLPMDTPIILENSFILKRIGIVCRMDKSLSPNLQEKMYLNAKCDIKYLDSGHAPFFSKAEELSRILMTN